MALISSIQEKSGVILSVLLLVVVIGVVAVSPPSGEITFFRFGAGSDNSAPSVSVSAPTSNLVEGQNAVITARAFDNKEVNRIYIYVDNRLVKACTVRAPTGSCVYNSNALPAGIHTYFVLAFDSSGNRLRDPASGTNSFTINAKTASTSTSGLGVSDGKSNVSISVSTPPRGKGSQFGPTGGGENLDDPYGLGRLYIDPASGSVLSRTYYCTILGSNAVFSSITITGSGNNLVYSPNYAFSPYNLNWDGKDNYYNKPGEVVPAGDYKLVAKCYDKKLEESIYVDSTQQKSSEYSIVPGQYRKDITQFGDFDIKNVEKIYFWGKPGGTWCAAGIKLKVYDSADKLLVEQNAKKVRAHEYTGMELAVNDLTIRKVVGSTNKEDWAGCSDIDEFGVVLFIKPTGGDKGGGTQTYDFLVGKSGSGKITSSDGKISCGTDCYEKYDSGAKVTLTATADSGSTFSSWSGCTSSTNACAITVDSDKTVTATFTTGGTQTYDFYVGRSGSGKVTSSDGKIDCGLTCYGKYDSGAKVTLTATADSGSTFSSWSGCTSSTNTCAITVDSVKTVTATFTTGGTPTTYDFYVGKSGSGKITSSDGKISCGIDCYEKYAAGTRVTLAATPDSGSTFSSWGGACSSAGTSLSCTVTMDGAKSVSAVFAGPVGDKTSPTVSASHDILNPQPGQEVTIIATASDDSGKTPSIALFVDGSVVAARCYNIEGARICEYKSAYASGTHNYYATATDSSGNVGRYPSSGARSFTVGSGTGGGGGGTGPDYTKPTVSFYMDPLNPVVNDKVTFKVTASDNVKVSKIDIYYDDKIVQTCTPNTASSYCTYVLQSAAIGVHKFYGFASDPSNNVGSTGVQSFTVGTGGYVDTEPPVIISLNVNPARPSPGDSVTINAYAGDKIKLLAAYIMVDGLMKKKCALDGTSGLCSFTTTYSETGTHTYYVIVDDAAGNRRTSDKKSFAVTPILF